MTVPFDDETLARVAANANVSAADLRAAAADVQSVLADWPGLAVDGLVYEWRQAFRDDPVLERTNDRWVLCVPERVWADVRERAGLDDETARALVALYAAVAGVDDQFEEQADRDDVVLVVSR